MNILIINASPHKSGASDAIVKTLCRELSELKDKCSIISLGTRAINACTACGYCKSGKGCIYTDLTEIADSLRNTDGLIFVTPTYYGGAVGGLLSLLSRLIYSEKRQIMNKPIASVGVGRRGCISSAIEEINRFFYFCASPIVTSGYPPIVYAKDSQSTERDLEGLQNLRSIAANMHWITKCITSGRSHGILPPIEETKICTDISSLTASDSPLDGT